MNDASLDWLLSLEGLGMKFGLENMSTLMRALGDPHHSFRSILVAGTNGKGSVTAILETALRTARYRSARYTSPHLLRLEERFVIGGAQVQTGVLAQSADRIRQAAEDLEARGVLSAPPTFFESATAIAFDLFRAAQVDIAVVEVGLGGRLDATNVLAPLVSIITTVDFDHQAQLGTTLESIAAEKAGIIKPDTPVVIGKLPAAAESVVDDVAHHVGAPVIRASAVADVSGMRPALPGTHQRDNAVVALAALSVLATRGYPVPAEAARFAVEHVQWPGRLEHARIGTCDVLFDAAHNPAGARALAEYLQSTGWTDATLVFGAMTDKDAAGMLEALAQSVRSVVLTTAATPRAASAFALQRHAQELGLALPVEVIDDPEQAFRHACARSARVVVAGSMFLMGPLRGILR